MNIKNIVKNFLSISTSNAANLLINLAAFALIARYLSIDDFGNFSILLAVVGIISKVVDFGVGSIVFRETSEDSTYEYLINTALTLRTIFFLITLFLSNSYLLLFEYSANDIFLFNILFISIIISSKMANFRDLINIPFKVSIKMQLPSVITVLDNLLFLLLVLLTPVLNGGIIYITVVYVLSNIPGFIITLIVLRRKYGYKFNFKLKQVNWLIHESLPLAGFIILMAIFQQVDLLQIKQLRDSYSAGLYAAGLRLVLPLNIIPTAIVTTVFPVFIRKDFNRDVIVQVVFKVLFFISVCAAIVFSFKSRFFINIIYSDKYQLADLTTAILFASQIFLFFNFFAISLFTAQRKQVWNLIYAALLVIINILLNFIFIPEWDFMGASLSKIISSFIGFILIVYLTRRIDIKISFINLRFFMWFFTLFISAYLLSGLEIIYYLILIIAVIAASTFIFKYFDNTEWKALNSIFQKS